jgi:WhiB family redox-sensing transcriptional regulator
MRLDIVQDEGWMDRGNCLGLDPDLFFPDQHGQTSNAKSICAACSVRTECLEYALNPLRPMVYGIWGGKSERERRALRRSRRLQQQGDAA